VTVVAPPDATVWWDVDDIAAAARQILRLTDTDVDAARIEDLVPAQGQRLNAYLDRTVPADQADPTLRQALVDMTVAAYKAAAPASPDLAFGVGYPPADPLTQVRGQVAAGKQRWGVG
jgi:hypothetical protein